MPENTAISDRQCGGNTNRIVTGDCFDVLDELPESSVHAVVTDPPYFLGDSGFMGREWDGFSDSRQYQEWCREWAELCRRVLKPGGHLLAFGGNTRHHRLNCGVEDAGFEIRDTLTWHYGSGFPKAADVSKVIDKRADAERETVGEYVAPDGNTRCNDVGITGGNYANRSEYGDETKKQTTPATDTAKKWDGWKTGLKPATEFVVMARKPFDGATVDCVLEHGTGALNIDGTRIGTEERKNPGQGTANGVDYGTKKYEGETVEGRYPSNVVFDETEAERLDREVGDSVSEGGSDASAFANGGMFADEHKRDYDADPGYGDKGGPSRYFYTSKATRAERTLDGKIDNAHPTVKPQDLMEWLVKLVTAEGQTVVDPFAGSGTTCKAAKDLGREFVGVERQAKWADVARVRCGLTPEDPSRVRDDPDQRGLAAFDGGGGHD